MQQRKDTGIGKNHLEETHFCLECGEIFCKACATVCKKNEFLNSDYIKCIACGDWSSFFLVINK